MSYSMVVSVIEVLAGPPLRRRLGRTFRGALERLATGGLEPCELLSRIMLDRRLRIRDGASTRPK